MEGERYLLCLYKGFNSLSNLEYDLGMPLNPVEMVWSIIVMGFQVYMSALILGTLLNYLVAKDPAGEAHKKRLDKVAQFCEVCARSSLLNYNTPCLMTSWLARPQHLTRNRHAWVCIEPAC